MDKFYNEWTFTGDIFYWKELDAGDFTLSLKLRGRACRVGTISGQIAEISCLVDNDLHQLLLDRKIKQYDTVTLQGHIEQWLTSKHGRPLNKIMLIADYLVEDK